MRLLVFNLVTDADDPVLGFTTVWLNALARHYEAVDVITMYAGRLTVAENVRVYSVGKERGFSEIRRMIEFYRILWRLLRQHRYNACFAHMQELFALMGAPLLKLYGVRTTLWYAHKAVTRKLVLAEKVVYRVVTPSRESFRVPSRKVTITGHGIDTEVFKPPDPPSTPRPLTIITVGRIAPAKRLHTLIDAAALLHPQHDFHLRVVGGVYPQDEGYAAGLRQQVERSGLGEVVAFVDGVPYDRVAHEYQHADLMVNLSATGSVDKAVLEAMACGLPTVTANEAFHVILAQWQEMLIVPIDDAEAVADKLAALMEASPQNRQALGSALRQIVLRDHSLERLIEILIDYFK